MTKPALAESAENRWSREHVRGGFLAGVVFSPYQAEAEPIG